MILQSLSKYYERLVNQPDVEIPEFGYSKEKISFSIVLNDEGDIVAPYIRDRREPNSKNKLVPQLYIVPSLTETNVRSSGAVSNFLWDKADYALGLSSNGKIDINSKKYKLFQKRCNDIAGICQNDTGLNAVISFLSKWNELKAKKIRAKDDYWQELKKGVNVVFELDSDLGSLVHEHIKIKDAWKKYILDEEIEYSKKDIKTNTQSLCLLTQKNDAIAQVHRKIKGIYNMKNAGALIGLNSDSFLSYGKKKSFNSPVSIKSAFAYSTALNYLLDRNNNQCISIGDTSTVYWTEKKNPVETIFGQLLDQKNDGSNEDITKFLDAMKNGKMPSNIETDVPFYILGLAPNAARISIRYWHMSTVGDMAEKIIQHFKDMEIVKSNEDRDPTYPGMWKILIETATMHKSENISPILAGNIMQAIIMGQRYPESLKTALLSRIRVDGNVNYIRAGMLKAIINRKNRMNNSNNNKEVITMALDKENKGIAYLLGRLFAVLEKVQQDAIPGANATIRDRYFGAASATPKIVFPQLLRNSQHHLSKIKRNKPKWAINHDKTISGIFNDIVNFPAHLSLDEQGLFAIGYYHQKQDIYTKKTEAVTTN